MFIETHQATPRAAPTAKRGDGSRSGTIFVGGLFSYDHCDVWEFGHG
jgi:hypothetical protein